MLHRKAIGRLNCTSSVWSSAADICATSGCSATPPRRARAAARSPRHARRDQHGSARRARPAGADRNGREGAKAQRRNARLAHSTGVSRSPASPPTACRTKDRRTLFISGRTVEWHLRNVFASSGSALTYSLGQRRPRTADPSRASNVDPGTDQGVTRARGTARGATLMRTDGLSTTAEDWTSCDNRPDFDRP